MKRRRMSRKSNKRNFRSGTKVRKKNMTAKPMRGGFRL